MTHEEQHEKLCEILSSLVPVLSADDLSLLAHHCGVRIDDFYSQKSAPKKLYFFKEIKEAA